jgi:hypothetical protein
MIVGAGLAGLIAAHAIPDVPIYEASIEPREGHKALLRFRSDAVARLTNIDFDAVQVHKGIWFNPKGGWVNPSIEVANLYSTKVLGKLLSRSIWNLDPVTRYIAPPDFYERLVSQVAARIEWGFNVDFAESKDLPTATISTAPLNVVANALGIDHQIDFKRAAITVERYRIPNCDIYQTVYFPTPHHSLYRASITGDLLILEFVGEPYGTYSLDVQNAFALPANLHEMESLGRVTQKFGKIAPINNDKRKALIGHLSSDYNIYSLGRFATWRNILLDDVVNDISVIKRLTTMDRYEQRLANT